MPLRRQQEQLRQLSIEIQNGAPVKEIFLPWTVGGGKSLAPVILSDLLTNGRKQIVVIPRNTLRQQGEAEYCNDIYPVNKTARIASNVGDPFRGCDSCFVTYQGIAADPERWINICRQYEVMLILDECHHLSGHGDWINGIREMKELSFLTAFLTGTAFRGDRTELPFFPYDKHGDIDMTDTPSRRWIEYTQEDALKDGAVLPFDTTLIDGSGAYIDLNGIKRSFSTLGDDSNNLRCVFSSEYAYAFLDHAFKEWLQFKKDNAWSKMLIVAKDIKTANEYTEYIKNQYPHIRSGVATSDDSKECIEVVKRAKKENSQYGSIECLISVGICYEGLNIPPVTHEAVMTIIRSIQWLQQCFGRVARNYPGKTQGWIYAPADKKMEAVLRQIASGSIQSATAEPPEQRSTGNSESTGTARTIEALSSQAHLPDQPTLWPDYIPTSKETQSEKEKRLRNEINSVVRALVAKESAGNRKVKERIFWLRVSQLVNAGRDENGKIIRKHLNEMTVSELEKVAEYSKMYKK